MNTTQRKMLVVETQGERIEIRVLQYKLQGTTASAATAPTVSTVFHSSLLRYKKFMRTWLHWRHQHGQLVQNDFLASVFTQSLMNVCTIAVTSMPQNYTPLQTT